MQSDSPNTASETLDEKRHRDVLKVCNYLHQGFLTAEEACERLLLGRCIEPSRAAEYIRLLPDEVHAAFPAVLASMPVSDEEWANFHRIAQFDGNERTWTTMILECRAGTEAIRACVLGKPSPPAAADFVHRVQASIGLG